MLLSTAEKVTHQTCQSDTVNPPLAARLSQFSDDRAIHNPHRPTHSFIQPTGCVFPKQFDNNKRNHSALSRKRLSKATSEMSVQFVNLTRPTVSRNE
jgi:hypothetical protein